MLTDDELLEEGVTVAELNRVTKLFNKLKHTGSICIDPSENGVIISREVGDLMWEIEFYSNGKLGITVDYTGSSDSRAVRVLKGLGQI